MERHRKKQKFEQITIEHLPYQPVLLDLVFSWLSAKEQQIVSQVCKIWYGVVYRNLISSIVKDIAMGLENKPVGVDLSLDSPIQPSDFETIFFLVESLLRFKYASKLVPGPGLIQEMLEGEGKYEWGQGCVCDICNNDMVCECISRMKMIPYSNHKLNVEDDSVFQIPILECNSRCKCSESCTLRVVQHGIRVDLQIFWTKSKNWGARTLHSIERGQFLCEYEHLNYSKVTSRYIGEVISTPEAKNRHRRYDEQHKNYLIVIREHFSSTNRIMRTNIDGTSFGNIARFFNHSCEPNLLPVLIRYNSLVPHVAFFAREDVVAGSELTFDYNLDLGGNTESQDIPLSNTPCLCGSKRCRKFLPFNKEV